MEKRGQQTAEPAQQAERTRSQDRKGIFWANLLHFYQPPDQDRGILERVVNESYHPVIRIFEQIPSAKATINIQGCLVELLIKTGFGKIVSRLKALGESGQIEFTMTPRFHPFLPGLPDEETDRQITQNTRIMRSYFGLYYNPQGFYSPELAYDTSVAKATARNGCRWLAVDEITISGQIGQTTFDKLFMDKSAGGLVLIPSDRKISQALAGSIFARETVRNTNDFIKIASDPRRKYVFTANDVEHFGHHQKGGASLLRLLYRDPRLESVMATELLGIVRKKEYCKPHHSDWTTTPEELRRGEISHTWRNPANKIHKILWELHKLAFDEIRNASQSGDILHNRARDLLGAASASCSFFWASCRPWWYGVYPENAATNMCLALFSLLAPSPKVKDRAFKLRQDIYNLVRQMNDSGEARKLQLAFLKSRNIDAKIFFENQR